MIFFKKKPQKISLAEIEKVADLAKISLSSKEKKKYQRELSAILSYIDIISSAPLAKEGAVRDSFLLPREDLAVVDSSFKVSQEAQKIYGFKKTEN